MNSATTRVHPEQMLVAKLLPYGSVENTDRSAYEAPAAFTDVRSRTTSSDAVVVRHVNIKNELPLSGRKCARSYSLPVTRLRKPISITRISIGGGGNRSGTRRKAIDTHVLERCTLARSRIGSGSMCRS